MKITETTPKVERVFTLEMSEIELRSIVIAMGITCDADRAFDARQRGVLILNSTPFYDLYSSIGRTLDAPSK
ncbi:hypothetical protein LOZ80_15160 [Paenibacillus sp. HWE-109]|uniref:hypothetical protein n=1 Tax=Paenibacillus sp. HWE-109 TaxID=1306526 RepID=UPI001EDD6AE2|nr:hypothetical protein [Paenibacillus sp. HWE-109]UKS30199.1 hypothetical protein LOZ80_15160 [Paenibacillus sp. HWE-109]